MERPNSKLMLFLHWFLDTIADSRNKGSVNIPVEKLRNQMTHLTNEEMKRWRRNDRLRVVVHSYNPNARKTKARSPQAQTSLGYIQKLSPKKLLTA